MPEQPPITATVGPAIGPAPPGKLETLYIILAWDNEDKDWFAFGGSFTDRSEAELYGARTMNDVFTHYRIVTIPGDE